MILDEIVEHKRVEVSQRKKQVSVSELESLASRQRPVRDFRAALAMKGMSLIAEIKRASPSKGLLQENLDAPCLARTYELAGARAISVLTDQRFFRGSLDDLQDVSQAVSIPVLRKDFIVNRYQVVEARAFGADAVLLIAAILDDRELGSLLVETWRQRMEALVEVHDEDQVRRALAAGARIIGINNRDLRTFEVDLAVTERLRPLVAQDRLVVGESGIRNGADVARLRAIGVDAILVGETLVRSLDVTACIGELLC